MGVDERSRGGDVVFQDGVPEGLVLVVDVAFASFAFGGAVSIQLSFVEEALAKLEQDGVGAATGKRGVEPAVCVHPGGVDRVVGPDGRGDAQHVVGGDDIAFL